MQVSKLITLGSKNPDSLGPPPDSFQSTWRFSRARLWSLPGQVLVQTSHRRGQLTEESSQPHGNLLRITNANVRILTTVFCL